MLPSTCVYETISLVGEKTTLKYERKQELYGYDDEVSHSIRFVADNFTTPLSNGKTMTVDGDTFRVMGYEFDASGVGVRVDLGSIRQ